jgi:hypothetical protein
MFATAAGMHASPAEAGVHSRAARAAGNMGPGFRRDSDPFKVFHAPRVGEAGGGLERNKLQGDRMSRADRTAGLPPAMRAGSGLVINDDHLLMSGQGLRHP